MTHGWARMLFWIGIVAVLALGIHLLSSILLPFAVGAVVAFLLNPIVERLVAWKVSRTAGTLLALIGFLTLLVVFGLLLFPLLQGQALVLADRFPVYLGSVRHQLDSGFELLKASLSADDVERVREAAGSELTSVLGGIASLMSRVLTGGIVVANLLSLIFITPIVTFFLLRDWDEIVANIDAWLPRQHVHTIREQAHLVQETLTGFIRGQASVCLLLGSFYAVGLTLLGLDSGLVIGFCVGLMLFIPFLGGLTGAVLATALALAQFDGWDRPLYVVLLFVVGQALEGNVITPKLVGDRVHLHPVWIMFALLAFGELFGFLGVLIAVPVAAVLGVLIRFALGQYLSSPLYDPLNAPEADAGL